MPDPRIHRPHPALACEFDPTPYAGSNLFSRTDNAAATTNATLPAASPRYWDLLAHLHGYGSKSGQSLADMMNDQLAGFGTWSCGFDAADKFYIENSLVSFSYAWMGTEDHSALGLPQSSVAAQAVAGGSFRMTAPNAWRRGIFQLPTGITVDISGTTYSLLAELPRVQCLPVWIRERATANDADDKFFGFTVEDIDPNPLSRWLVEPDGRVSVSYYEEGGFSIENAAWWRRLGGDGEETPINDLHGRKRLTTANPAPCFLASRRGYVELRRETEIRDSRQIMTDGSVVSAGLPVIRGWDFTMRVEGPAHGYSRDQEDHLRAWWSYARGPMTFYPAWGDGDHAAGSMDTRRHVDRIGTAPASRYTLLQTSGADAPEVQYHKRQGGRLLVRLHPRDDMTRREAYDGQLDVHQDVDFKLLDDPSR